MYYENKISRFAKDYLLTPKKPSSAAYTAKIEYDLEKKMRSSRLTPSTKEKMNLVFNQLFQKKETKKKELFIMKQNKVNHLQLKILICYYKRTQNVIWCSYLEKVI